MSQDNGEERSRRERLLLGGEGKYTRQQVADEADVGLERAQALWRAMGFANTGENDAVFTDADVDALRTVTGLRDSGVIDAASELGLTRALSQALAGLADFQLEILERIVADHVAEADDREAVNAAGIDTADALLPPLERLQRYVWRRHLLASSEHIFATVADETTPMTVGFADIVGFTSLSRGLDQRRLAEFLDAFESTMSTVVAEHGARVIKTVGDEVMFLADTPTSAADIGLTLAERISELDGRPDLRVGLAFGPVLRRLGDAYGTVVNMASRLTSVARPGSVLVNHDLAKVISDDPRYRLSKLRRVSVRGFAHLQPWLLRRSPSQPEDV